MAIIITNGYCTLADLKAALKTTDTIDDDALSNAINAASRNIDDFTGRFFYPDGTTQTPVVRYYSPTNIRTLFVDDFVSVSEVAIDWAYSRTWSSVLAINEYMVEPINNPRKGRPYDRIICTGGSFFPESFPQSVRVTGVWGWSAVPEVVRQACLIQSSRLFNRAASPFGIAGSPDLGVVRLSARLDPDVQVLLSSVCRMDGLVY